MSFCQVEWFSQVLRKQVGMFVLLPDQGQPPFPTFYLLHGLSDDHTIWHRRTRIEWYVRDLPLIVAMADGYRGFYTNNTEGPAYADYLAIEMQAFMERSFPAATGRANRCVGGLSMGGYGALRLALGFPDRYVSATSHSGALLAGSRPIQSDRFDVGEISRIFGPDPTGSDHDLLTLAERAKKAGNLPRIRIDCGTDDFLIDDNRECHRRLDRLGIPHEYEEFPGAHTWDYWDLHVQEALRFHAQALGISSTG
jgi:S-formylglutathione hydrolase FrmB